jgi:hypothetical protein
MKKLVLSLAILGFVAFGALTIQNLVAATSQVEVVNYDKDPKKEDTKKAADTKAAADTKEVKAETKSTGSCEKSCASSCSDKSASAKVCSDTEKAACCPDKK